MLKYTKDHEWLRMDGDVATIGITPYAQEKARRSRFCRVAEYRRKARQGRLRQPWSREGASKCTPQSAATS